MGAAGWTAIADALEEITSLTSLNTYTGYAAIRAGGLAELELAGTELAVVVARYLARSADTLTTLDLRCCPDPSRLSYAPTESFCHSFLSLAPSRLSSSHLSRIFRCHFVSITLANLTMPYSSDNAIGPEGGTAVGEALAAVTSLTSLDMGYLAQFCRVFADIPPTDSIITLSPLH